MPSTMRSLRLLILSLGLVLAFPTASLAQVEPYDADALGLIGYQDQVQAYTSGSDVIEVFLCDVPDGSVVVDLNAVIAEVNTQLQPYFAWLSNASYVPIFVAGTTLTATQASGWPDIPQLQPECESLADQASSGTANGAMIIVDAAYSGGYATGGLSCDVVSDCPSTFPANGRNMVVGANTVVPSVDLPSARMSTIAHELGHMLEFPHSYGGLTTFINGLVYEYDNPMDVMSGGNMTLLNVGTLALNRYAAGWLDTAVQFHRGGTEDYQLATIGNAGTQLLVLPTDVIGLFTVIDAREAASFDSGVAAQGVEVYQIDQRPEACGAGLGEVCWGVERRTIPVPAIDDPEGFEHVFGVGGSFSIGGAQVAVTAQTGGVWSLTVTGSTVSERFVDDNGSIHEANIAAIAALGVTKGCNPPLNSFYCPFNSVTRAEMAVFLTRALNDDIAPTNGVGVFSDVSAGEWYSDAVARMFELGITTGYADGTYLPFAPVSRGEMAVFLDRAFEQVALTSTTIGFVDVVPDAFYGFSTQALFDSGVTTGCNTDPLSFCPADQVTRDQMASFLARVLVP